MEETIQSVCECVRRVYYKRKEGEKREYEGRVCVCCERDEDGRECHSNSENYIPVQPYTARAIGAFLCMCTCTDTCTCILEEGERERGECVN